MSAPHDACSDPCLLMTVQIVHLQALPKNWSSGIIPCVGNRCCCRPHDGKAFFRAQHPPLCAFIALELMGVKFPPYVSKYF